MENSQSFVVDIHNHLAVKTYLYEGTILEGNIGNGGVLRRIGDELWTNPEVNIVELQTDLQKMKKANMNALIVSHYVPEFGLLEYLKDEFKFIVNWIVKPTFPKIHNRVEKKSWTTRTFEATLESLDTLERYVKKSQQAGWKVSIPHDLFSMERDLNNGNTVILHSVEGAHHLGRKLDYATYVDHLHELSRRGVCYLTLAHFFRNDFVDPIEGLPPDIRAKFDAKNYPNAEHYANDSKKMLHPNSQEFIEEMLSLGMIIDLTHSGRGVRDQVFEINKNRRPIIFSHTGVQNLFDDQKHDNDKLIGVTDDDIRKIKACGGLIGIIFYNYWLTGKEEKKNSKLDFGFEHILKSIEHIHKITGDYKHIAIGSDFDGMTDPPDDVANVERYTFLREELLKNGLTLENIDDIMGNNMLRVLRKGWR